MVNIGRPSTGCFTCRKRRIKCDERQPQCFRCEKARRMCEGYPDAINLLFRSENDVAKKNSTLWKRPLPHRGSKTEDTEKRLSAPSPTSTHNLTINGDDLVLCHMFRDTNVDGNSGLRLARDLCFKAVPASALTLSTLALAWVCAPDHPSTQSQFVNARRNYNGAVAELQRSLREPALAPKNETLMGILTLAMTESALGDARSLDVALLHHIKGATSFVNATHKNCTESPFYQPAFAVLFHHMLLGWITYPNSRLQFLSSEFKQCLEMLEYLKDFPAGTAELIRLGLSAIRIYSEVRIHGVNGWLEIEKHQLEGLLQRCLKVLQSLARWSRLWHPKGNPLSENQKKLFDIKPNWTEVKAQESISMWFRKDYISMCIYKLVVQVASRRCVEQLLLQTSNESSGSPGEERRNLLNVNSRMQSTIEYLTEELRDFVPIFLESLRCKCSKAAPKRSSGTESESQPFLNTDRSSPCPKHDFWDHAPPRMGIFLLFWPVRAANSIPDLSHRARANIIAAAELIADHTLISRQFVLQRIGTQVYD